VNELRQSLITRLLDREESPALYVKPNKMQIPVFNSTSKENWVFSGNGAGKTAGGVLITTYHTTGEYPKWWKGVRMTPPIAARIVCTSFVDGIEKVILPELNKWMPKKYLLPDNRSYNRQTRIFRLNNGSTIDLMSYDQDIQAFSGATRQFIWQDEHGKQEVYNENKARLRGSGPRFFLGTLTPLLGMTWEFGDIYEERRKGTIAVFRGSTWDNRDNIENIEEYVDTLTKGLSEAEKKARLYGDFVALTGLLYPTFDHDVHTIQPFAIPRDWPRYNVCDPHDRKPFALGWYTVSPINDVYFYDEWPPEPFHKLTSCDKTPKDYATLIRLKEGKDKIIRRIIDPNFGKAPKATSGTTVIYEFDQYGLHFDGADDNMAAGHLKVRDYLEYDKTRKVSSTNKPKVFFFNTLQNFIYGMTHYIAEGETNPKYQYKDFADLVRYALIDNPQYINPKDKPFIQTKERGISGYGE